jgi:hypothetical protein
MPNVQGTLALAFVTLAIVAAGTAARAQTKETGSSVDLKGKLYRSFFVSGAGMLTPADLPAIPEPLRARLSRYLKRRTAFKSSYKSAPDTIEQVRADAKKREIERAIVSAIEAPGIEQMAADFVAKAAIADTWEGTHAGPLGEAHYAEEALKTYASSPLAPWFYVFIAQRQRVAFEAYENEKDQAGMKAAAATYRAYVDRARAVDDPFFAALILDMERQPYLYIKSTNHPKDY